MLTSPLKKIAITGALACGKSSAGRFFSDLSAYVVSADAIVHDLLSNNCTIIDNVVSLFGAEIAAPSVAGKLQLDRSKIAQRAFAEPRLLRKLEELLHPAVQQEIEKQYRHACQQQGFTLFVVEIPLLFEISAEEYYDVTIAVTSDPQQRIQRFMDRTGSNEQEYYRRMACQLPSEEKAARATYTLVNNGSLEQLRAAVQELYNKITS
jgi:dephospho-CoA kinase